MKLRTKLIGGGGLGMAAIVLMSAMAFMGNGILLGKASDVMQNKEVDRILIQAEVDHLVWGSKVTSGLMDPTVRKLDVQMDAHKCNFGIWFYGEGRKQAEKTAPYLAKSFENLEGVHAQLHGSAEQLNELISKGDRNAAAALYLQKTKPIVGEIIGSFNSMREDVKKHAISDEILVEAVRNNRITIGLLGVAFSLVLMIISVLLTRNVTISLHKVITGLTDNADQVYSTATQVSASSQYLAESTSRQASSLEETSSSLEEMSQLTRQNDRHASEAKTIMEDVNAIVQKVNRHMADMSDAVNEITKSSEETGKIIKTIDEIAFQTNLLAHNAAVEAARAGEAGAGFAVVASEVRNLAMRASDAAKNTSQLIENTISAVKKGNELTNATQDSFKENASISEKVVQIVEEIAAASERQADGIHQLSLTVSDMDKLTQTTAASSEESAVAAEGLHDQAAQMKNAIRDLLAVVDGIPQVESDGRAGMSARGNLRVPAIAEC